MIVAADLADITLIVRVSDSDRGFILRILDMGAQGIVIPHVDGLEGAKEAVSAVHTAASELASSRQGFGSNKGSGTTAMRLLRSAETLCR